jgi:chemotaxis protein CheX
MDIRREDLEEVVTMIWDTMLGMELAPASGTIADCDGVTYTGSVQINGDWNGDVRLHCGHALASEMASAMFGADVDDLAVEEVRDALGELTNMSGGSVKALIPGSCQLGLPTIAEGAGHRLVIPGAKLVVAAEMTCQGEALLVSLHEAV